MDGWITIGTELSTNKFDRQIADLEKKMQKEEDKKVTIEAKIDTQTAQFEEAIAETDKYAEALERVQKLKAIIAGQNATPEQFTQFQNLTREFGTEEQIVANFDKALAKQDKIQQQLEKTKSDYSVINNKVEEYARNIERVRIQKHQKDVEGLKNSVEGVTKSFRKSVVNAGKLALGIFGIRSAYMMLRQASSQLGQYDKQYATDLEYIRYVLTMMIAPTLKTIIQYVLQGLQYINMLLNGLFGINLFTNASADAFNRMKKGASGVSSAVKEIKKDLLGFDEINRLTDNGGVAAGASGVGMPSLDIADISGETPGWIRWIVDNKDLVLNILGAIAALIASIKITMLLSGLKGIFTVLQGLSTLQIFGLVAGVVVALAGIVQFVFALIDYIKNPSWSKFEKVLQGIEIVLIGIGAAMLALQGVTPLGLVMLLTGALSLLGTQLLKNTSNTEKNAEAQERLNKAYEATKEATDAYVRAVDDAEGAEKALIEAEKRHRIVGQDLYDAVQNGTLDYKDMTDAQREVYKAYLNNEKAQENLQKQTENLGKTTKEEAVAFKQAVSTNVASGLGSALSSLNEFSKKWNSTFEKLKKNITVGASFGIGAALSVKGYAKGGVFYPNMLPRLASGGIVNMPGRGAAYGGAVIGERGAEAVVPLTDSQQMELLGATIGKYITINANIVNTMNGRVISRELKQIQNEQDFAYNT